MEVVLLHLYFFACTGYLSSYNLLYLILAIFCIICMYFTNEPNSQKRKLRQNPFEVKAITQFHNIEWLKISQL